VARIERLHWDNLGLRVRRGGAGDEPGTLFALWPEPVDHDACLAAAGFARFADSDDAWDADLEGVLAAVIAALGAYGAVTVSGEPPPRRRSRRGRPDSRPAAELSPARRLALVAGDDQLAPCLVELGAPVRAFAFVSDGHPIVWIWLHAAVARDWPGHLAAFASGREVCETRLAWAHLVPAALPVLS
jgi:hypothetical protein